LWDEALRQTSPLAKRTRTFLFGAASRDPVLYPEANIVPGAVPLPWSLAGRVDVEILDFGLSGLGPGEAPYLVYLAFHACAVWSTSAAQEEGEVLSGLYRSGFESSDFHLLQDGTRLRLRAEGDVWESLQSYLVERLGRASSVTAEVTLRGRREPATEDLSFLGAYDGIFIAEGITAIRPLSPEEFNAAVGALPGRN